MRPSDALEARADLLTWLLSPAGRARAGQVANRAGLPGDALPRALAAAEALYVAPPIIRLISGAAATMPADTSLGVAAFPWPHGWVYLPVPLAIPPSQSAAGFRVVDGQHQIRALLWLLRDLERPDGRIELDNALTILALAETPAGKLDTYGIWGLRVADVASGAAAVLASRAAPEADDADWLRAGRQVGTWLTALLLFLDQRILVEAPQRPDRAARRRLSPEHEPQIQVIELRARQARRDGEADQHPVDWHYQWVVRGHWRRQYYPSAQQHRPVWVAPYVKGPEGRPLKAPSARVFAVTR